MKKCLLVSMLVLLTNSIVAQDTIYLNDEWKETKSLKTASFYKITEIGNSVTKEFRERTFFKSGVIKSDISYILNTKEKRIRNGTCLFWYDSGALKNEINYENGKKNGFFLSYWKNGILKRRDTYKKGKLKNGTCWNEKGEPVEYYAYEIHPKFPGGNNKITEYVRKNLRYPPISEKHKLGGRVIISFTVGADGTVKNIELKKGVNKEINDEAIRLVQWMPKWEPGFHDGVAVDVKYQLPINFDPGSMNK